MRKRFKDEEAKKNEEKRILEIAKKKFKQEQEKRRTKNDSPYLTYDLSGKRTTLVPEPRLPNIMNNSTACKVDNFGMIKNENGENFPETASRTFRKMNQLSRTSLMSSSSKTKETPDIILLRKEAKEINARINSEEKQPELKTLKSVYDALVPQAGVVYYEKGKTIKEAQMSFKDSLGRISKGDFNSSLISMQNSSRTLTNNPVTEIPIIPSANSEKLSRNNPLMKSLPVLPGGLRMSSHRKNIEKVEISGDLTQLWENSNYYYQNGSIASIHPKMYVPPTYRENNNTIRNEQKLLGSPSTENDNFNMNLSHGFENLQRSNTLKGGIQQLPVKIKRRLIMTLDEEKRGIKKIFAKKVREKQITDLLQKHVKLPPPPIGKSIGHGIFKRNLQV